MKEPESIEGLSDIVDKYDAFFLDQFGVLHYGQRPYPDVVATLEKLHYAKKKIVILTNSGKRSEPNLQRLVKMGFPELVIDHVVSSGEVAWRGIKTGNFGVPFVGGKSASIIGKNGDDYDVTPSAPDPVECSSGALSVSDYMAARTPGQAARFAA